MLSRDLEETMVHIVAHTRMKKFMHHTVPIAMVEASLYRAHAANMTTIPFAQFDGAILVVTVYCIYIYSYETLLSSYCTGAGS